MTSSEQYTNYEENSANADKVVSAWMQRSTDPDDANTDTAKAKKDIDAIHPSVFLPKNAQGVPLEGKLFRHTRREKALELLSPDSKERIQDYAPRFHKNNKGLHRVYNMSRRFPKLAKWWKDIASPYVKSKEDDTYDPSRNGNGWINGKYFGEIKQADFFNPTILEMQRVEGAKEFAKNHPGIDQFLHRFPVTNGIWTYMKTDRTSPKEMHNLGRAFTQDAITLAGTGLAAKEIGLGPAIAGDIGVGTFSHLGNKAGEWLENNLNAPKWTSDVLEFLGGVFGGGTGAVAGNVGRNYRTLKKYNEVGYTGVPGKHLNGDPNAPKMSDVAKDYDGIMWTTPTKEYAEGFARDGNGKVFKVLVNDSKLKVAEAPRAAKGTFFAWTDLPYEFKNGKFTFKDDANIWSNKSGVFPDNSTALSRSWGDPNYADAGLRRHGTNPEGIHERLPGHKYHYTDNVVESAFDEGYDAVKLYDVYDGGYLIGGKTVDVPINEKIINAGVPRLTLDLGESKWKHLTDWNLYKKLNP